MTTVELEVAALAPGQAFAAEAMARAAEASWEARALIATAGWSLEDFAGYAAQFANNERLSPPPPPSLASSLAPRFAALDAIAADHGTGYEGELPSPAQRPRVGGSGSNPSLPDSFFLAFCIERSHCPPFFLFPLQELF